MKVCRALKILSITASLLGSSFPAYAQDDVEEKGWISSWASWLTGEDSEDEQENLDSRSDQSSILGSIRPHKRPREEKLKRLESMNERESANYFSGINVHQMICSGDIPNIQLNGLDDLVQEISRSCGIEVGNFSTESSVLFCQEVNNRFKDGACFDRAINQETVDGYLDSFYNNSYVREAFIEEQQKKLTEEKEKMSKLKSIQFSLANDPQSLAELKDILYKSMQDENGYNYFKESFNLDEQTAQWIKSGRIPLSEFSDAAFQCSPSNIPMKAEDNPYDYSLENVCGEDERGNDLFNEVKDRIAENNVFGSSLLAGEATEAAIEFEKEIDDTFKMMIPGIYRGVDPSQADDSIIENASVVYAETARMLFSAMDAHPDGSRLEPLIESASQVINNDSLTETQKIDQIRGDVLNQSVSSLLASYSEDSPNYKILSVIKDNFITRSEDGVSRLALEGQNAAEVISSIKNAAGIVDSNLDTEIKTIAQSMAATSTLGSQIYKSEQQRIQGVGINSLTLNLLSNSTPGSENKKEAAKNAVMNNFRDYLRETDRDGKGARDIARVMAFIQNNNANSNVTVSPRLEMKENLLLVSSLLAQDCNSLINRNEERKRKNFCPRLMDPIAANAMLKGVVTDPSSMEGNVNDRNVNILTACRAIGFNAVLRARVEENITPATTLSNARRIYAENARIVCDMFSQSNILSPDLLTDPSSDANCGNTHDISAMAEEFTRFETGSESGSNPLVSGMTNGATAYSGSDRMDFIGDTQERSDKILRRSNFSSNGSIQGKTEASNLLDTYTGSTVTSPGSFSSGASTIDSGTGSSSGINSNIFSTNNVTTPVTNSSFVSTIEGSGDGDDLISSQQLKREFENSAGGIDPNIQKILDKMAAMEQREKNLIDEQKKLRSLINNPSEIGGVENDELDQSQSDLAAVTAELDALKKEMSSLVTDARKDNQKAGNDNYRVSNFSNPSASPTPSSSQRAPASVGSHFNGNSVGGSNSQLPSSSSSSSGGSLTNTGGKGYSAGGGILGNVSPDGLTAPAYTQNETFVLTQSIRDKAPIMPAGVSIEQAVLENKGAILVPYGNGEYMYVEPELSESGDILTRDGRVVYKEVLKVSDPEVIASRGNESGERAPASVEEFDPAEKIYDWDDFSRQLDEAQN